MVSALSRKSITDLSRRRSRTVFAVATLALAVASIGIFALPALMDRSMRGRGRGREAGRPDRIHEPARARPGAAGRARVAAERARGRAALVLRRPQVYIGARRAPVEVVGVPDFAAQRVDVVRVASGATPRANEVLTERQNANQGLLDVGRRRHGARDRRERRDRSAARQRRGPQPAAAARTRPTTTSSSSTRPPQTVALLSGVTGYQSLAFRLADTRPAAVATTTAAIRRALIARAGVRRLHVAAGGARDRATGLASPTSRRSPTSST